MPVNEKPPHQRHLEDSSRLNEYINLYSTGSYAFTQAGGNDSDCEMKFYYDYSGDILWSYNCWSYNVPELEQRYGTNTIHPLYCYGLHADFDNFTCILYVHDVYQDVPWLQMVIDCTEDDVCTCSGASIQGVPCDLCETCTKFSTSDIALWTTTPWIVPNVHLSCPADSIYEVSQMCPTRISASRQRDLGWFAGGVLVGVIGAATMTAYYWFRQKRNQTALSFGKENDNEESNYAFHDGRYVT